MLRNNEPEIRHLLSNLDRDWAFHARENQLPPTGDWLYWVIMSGRGWGKTRTGAELVLDWIRTGQGKRIALIGQNMKEVHKIMLYGESGLITIAPADFKPRFVSQENAFYWPNGAVTCIYSGDNPETLRGPQHDKGWLDELAKWRYSSTCFSQFEFGLRLGDAIQAVITTTPRPVKVMFDLTREARKSNRVRLTVGNIFENRDNLSKSFLETMLRKYDGTTMGRQELYGHLFDDLPGALWTRSTIDRSRLAHIPTPLERIIVAIDPAVSANDNSNETGIVVVGRDSNGKGYVLEDLSGRYSPREWARLAINAYIRHEADCIVGEVNNGGNLIEANIRAYAASDPALAPYANALPYRAVRASRGKVTRAEPISVIYERGHIHHVGSFPELEDQMCSFVQTASDREPIDVDSSPDSSSPDRVDAMVWGFTELFLDIELAPAVAVSSHRLNISPY